MAWANQETIKHLNTLPEAALSAYAMNPEWKVSEIIHHIVESADFYAFRILGSPPHVSGDSIQRVEKISDLDSLAKQAEELDSALFDCAKLDDIQMEFTNSSGNLVKRWRSTILSQAIHHATEHRAQIAAALEAKGWTPVDLDELDLWSFEIEKG